MREYRICNYCVMDTSDLMIEFDSNGRCNHCLKYEKNIKPLLMLKKDKSIFKKLINKIKNDGKNNKYDSIIGLSGGKDSSYIVHLAKLNGLRPLIIHFDNGWDSELAIQNIENIIKKTNFDYINYIVDWEEFKDLQLAYFKASVVDIEVPTDMGIYNIISLMAFKYKIKYHLFGANIESESIMGKNWRYSGKKIDIYNLIDIHKNFGTKRLKTFPIIHPIKNQYLTSIYGLKKINILNYVDSNYEKIKEILNDEYGWLDYSVKHGESVFTKFYQSYILPKKFGFDKRRAHLSDLICSDQISRDEAIGILKTPIYKDDFELNRDYEFVLNKWGLSEQEFGNIMNQPIVEHGYFKTYDENDFTIENIIMKIGKRIFSFLRFIGLRNSKGIFS